MYAFVLCAARGEGFSTGGGDVFKAVFLHSKHTHDVLESAVCTDSCKWIYHQALSSHNHAATHGWLSLYTSSAKDTNNIPDNLISPPMCEKCERVGPETSFVVLYSSGNVKQLDILKTGKPNIGTTLHTVLFKQEQILWNTNAAQLMRCQWRWKPEYGPRATLAEPQRINVSHAHTYAHSLLFQMDLVCNICHHWQHKMKTV